MDPIRTFFAALLRALLPWSDRQQADGRTTHVPADELNDLPAGCPPARLTESVARGEDIGHVRPYLVAHERQEAQRRRARRRTLLLAVHGIDIGPWNTHGVRVAV